MPGQVLSALFKLAHFTPDRWKAGAPAQFSPQMRHKGSSVSKLPNFVIPLTSSDTEVFLRHENSH